MLLTITTTRAPATDLGYLLHKHPDRPQSFAVSAGEAHVFYPEATPERCTAALLLEVDPIALVRGHKHSHGELGQYVNDRTYAASSMLAVAIKEAFRSALTGRCDARPDLAAARIPLTIRVPALRCRGSRDGTALADRVFGPLGWSVDAPLAVQRREAILAVLRHRGARRVGDLGCGAGALTRDLLADSRIEHVIAVDVSARALQLAARHLKLDQMPDSKRQRLTIFQSSLTYRDDRLAGLDAAVLMEVIEHLDPERLPALERVVFGFAAPAAVVVTTPNAEYNVHFSATMAPGALRHRDHRFEWTRAEFRGWAEGAASNHGYQVRFLPVGPEHPDTGPPTQLAVFERETLP